MEVTAFFGMSLRTGSVAELSIGIFVCRFKNVFFMTERIGKHYIEFSFGILFGCSVASILFGNVGRYFVLNTKFLAYRFCGVDEVLVVSRTRIVKGDKADFYVCIIFNLLDTFVRGIFLLTTGHSEATCNGGNYGYNKC